MASPTFVQLAGGLVEAMGQRLDAAKPLAEGLVLQTEDGFLYAFLEDPDQVSLESVRRIAGEGVGPARLVVLTPGRLPLAITAEVLQRSGTVIEGARFAELARQLGLESLMGEEPRRPPEPRNRLLPSAQLLDAVMGRARTWLDWGVPALALRFYRQAAAMKPGFLPARIGIGRSLLGLGLLDDADRLFAEVRATRPDDLDARLGQAAVLGARAKPREEIAIYRALLAEDEARVEVRAHLVAALVDLGDWAAARVEIEAMLERTPEEPQLRFLHAIALERTGPADASERERAEARRLGLTVERERALCQHLGIPLPPLPGEAAGPPARGPARRRGAKRTAPDRPRRTRRAGPRRPVVRRGGDSPRRARHRKGK
ncbi:MAG TPA: tetratricopeptide repeat protein [Thermoplasmata archaeon]|nr:tetratricopeptide repeat protein [Thermoplasmata archaeon]